MPSAARQNDSPPSKLRKTPWPIVPTNMRCGRITVIQHPGLFAFPLTRQLAQALAAGRQFSLFDDQDREAVFDFENQSASLAGEMVPFER
jgi:hypothetical protein